MKKLIVFFSLILFGASSAVNAQKEDQKVVNQLVVITNDP